VFHGLQHGAAQDDDRGLVQWIAGRGGVATARDVARGLAKYRAPGAAEAGLRRLTRSGRSQWHPQQTGGRPADAVRLRGYAHREQTIDEITVDGWQEDDDA